MSFFLAIFSHHFLPFLSGLCPCAAYEEATEPLVNPVWCGTHTLRAPFCCVLISSLLHLYFFCRKTLRFQAARFCGPGTSRRCRPPSSPDPKKATMPCDKDANLLHICKHFVMDHCDTAPAKIKKRKQPSTGSHSTLGWGRGRGLKKKPEHLLSKKSASPWSTCFGTKQLFGTEKEGFLRS